MLHFATHNPQATIVVVVVVVVIVVIVVIVVVEVVAFATVLHDCDYSVPATRRLSASESREGKLARICTRWVSIDIGHFFFGSLFFVITILVAGPVFWTIYSTQPICSAAAVAGVKSRTCKSLVKKRRWEGGGRIRYKSELVLG